MAAARNGHHDICRLLIDKGAQLEAKNTKGLTPLHIAVTQGHIEIVRLLCDRGADIEAQEFLGRRTLHNAVFYGHISVVKELIEVRHAEINARDNDGRTALWWARQKRVVEIASCLVSRGGVDDIVM